MQLTFILMKVLNEILEAAGLQRPDRRPLHAYPATAEQIDELRRLLRLRVFVGEPLDSTAAAFVFWAAEHIRANFHGGQLTWSFVFDGLKLVEDRDLGWKLVDRGLRWWWRNIRTSHAGHRLFLYSLMVEGGLPQALLVQPGLYGRVIKGMLSDIEGYTAATAPHVAVEIAYRWVFALPQVFQTDEIAQLLADFALALAKLRAQVPSDIPIEQADRWLDKFQPHWAEELPLRISQEVAAQLIRPALRAERAASLLSEPLAKRTLVRVATGKWHSRLNLVDRGTLPEASLAPEAAGLRLRLLPSGSLNELLGNLVYAATPEDGGWTLRRLGGSGTMSVPLELDVPLTFAAYADGRFVGEVELTASMPLADEAPSFWHPTDYRSDGKADELQTLTGPLRSKASAIWCLTSLNQHLSASDGATIEEAEQGPLGVLWRISGSGQLKLGPDTWRVETGADVESVDAQIHPYGEFLSSWRLPNGGLVFRGFPKIRGHAPRNIFTLNSAARPLLKRITRSPTKAIEMAQENRQKTVRLISDQNVTAFL